MMTMRFRSTCASALLILVLGCGGAFAQDSKAKPIYNGQGPAGNAAAPLFLNNKGSAPAQGMIGGVLPSKKAYGMNSAVVASSPQNVQKAAQKFQENAARQQAANKQLRDSRLASMRAEFDATRAQEEAADAARMKQMAMQQQAAAAQAGVGPGGQLPATATAPGVSPYAGSNVVFTGRKKDGEEKPVRLFNTR